MNNFDKIIKNKTKELLEYATNPAIKQAVDNIEKALRMSGQVSSNPNSAALADELFHITKEGENPLQNAFNKIKDNPKNPNLTSQESEAYLNYAKQINPEKETKENEKDSTTSSETYSTTKPISQQPNANQYNPLAQK